MARDTWSTDLDGAAHYAAEEEPGWPLERPSNWELHLDEREILAEQRERMGLGASR